MDIHHYSTRVYSIELSDHRDTRMGKTIKKYLEASSKCSLILTTFLPDVTKTNNLGNTKERLRELGHFLNSRKMSNFVFFCIGVAILIGWQGNFQVLCDWSRQIY